MWNVARRLTRDTWKFVQVVRGNQIDVVHVNPSLGAKAALRDGLLLMAARAMGRRTIVFIHGWDSRFETAVGSRFRRPFAWAINHADICVVLGKCFVPRLRALGYRKEILTAGAPVDDELLREAAVFEPVNRSGGDFTLLFLARLERDKGIYEAIETYRALRPRYPALRMIVAGTGTEFENVRRLGREQGITVTGHVEGKTKCAMFRMADAYLFPSHHEGLPISVLEAMAFGLPVVTSRVGGLPDFFEDGKMGFMALSRSPAEFASLIEPLITDRAWAQRIGIFNRQYAREHFSGASIAAELEEIYAAVAGGSDRAVLSA